MSASAIIFVYDITDKESFTGLKNWIEEIEFNAVEDVFKILVANKCDNESERKVSL